MKNYIKFLILSLTTTFFVSCSDVDTPEVDFTVNNLNPTVGEKVTFTITGDAETFVIFTGDASHEFEKSHLAITSGLDVDQELVVMVADSLPKIKDYLQGPINNHNSTAGANNQVDIDVVMTNIATLVDKEYTNKLTAAYEIWEFVSVLQGQTIRDLVDLYFQNKSDLLAPPGGFSTGFAVDRYDKKLEYTYSTPGMYVVTLVATNVGDKLYTGSGYQDDRTSSGDEYNLGRVFRELVITVQP